MALRAAHLHQPHCYTPDLAPACQHTRPGLSLTWRRGALTQHRPRHGSLGRFFLPLFTAVIDIVMSSEGSRCCSRSPESSRGRYFFAPHACAVICFFGWSSQLIGLFQRVVFCHQGSSSSSMKSGLCLQARRAQQPGVIVLLMMTGWFGAG